MSEVLAGQAGQEQKPATAIEAPAGLSLEGAKPYLEAFGNRGAKWYLEGRSMADCFGDLSKELIETNTALLAQVADLQTRLDAALQAAGGESEALSADPKIEMSEAKKAALQKAQELKAQGASDKTARWGAAFAN